MDTFIDESGAHKKDGHATTAVVCIEIKNREQFEGKVKQILEELHIDVFHWARHGWKIKEKFFKEIMQLDFTFMVAIFRNPYHPEKMVEIVFQHLLTSKAIKTVSIDGEKPKWYERKLKKVLRDKGIPIKKLHTVRDERAHPGIQLADALAGLVRYHYDNPQEEMSKRIFRRLKKEKKLSVQILFESEVAEKHFSKT